jgi:integrase
MPSKRGNNEGSIVKRSDGRWMARITLPDGERKHFYAKTRQEAARQLAEALRDLAKGLPIVGERQTVEQYLAQWLKTAQPSIRLSSWRRYEELTRVHIVPVLGSMPLSRLSAQHLNTLYAAKLGEGLSSTTVHYLHVTMHRALGEALRLGLVQRNVSEFATPPRRRRRKMQVLTSAQARAFLQSVRGDPLEALYVVAITTGMRLGELLALRWSDVDLAAAHLQVRSTLHWYERVFEFAEPKTMHSRRKVALSREAVRALDVHERLQREARSLAGKAWHDLDLVFPDAVGRPLRGTNVLQTHFTPALARAGLPPIRFHDLRHTAATLMLLKGIHPKVVSEMLGHTTISITLDLYSHVLPDMQREAAAAMDELLQE